MKVRLGKLTGSPETGADVAGIYWNDSKGFISGVSFIDYTDKKGRARRIWPDSDIVRVQSVQLGLTAELTRMMANFETQRELLKRSVGSNNSITIDINGKRYSVHDTKNTRWDAATNSLQYLRNSGPIPGRIERGDYATVSITAPAASLTLQNDSEELTVLVANLAPITTCDVEMKACWRNGATTSSGDGDKGHIYLCDESGQVLKEVTGGFNLGRKKKWGGRKDPTFWDGNETVKGISYNGSIKTRGPVKKCTVKVTWPAYQASFTVRVVDVVCA